MEITDDGVAVSVEVFNGNTTDSDTFLTQNNRKNRYKMRKTPVKILGERSQNISPGVFNFNLKSASR
jgi:hypothetical protein